MFLGLTQMRPSFLPFNIYGDTAIQSPGPSTENALSPYFLCMRGFTRGTGLQNTDDKRVSTSATQMPDRLAFDGAFQ